MRVRHQCIILSDGPGVLARFCGVSILERQLRTLQRCGLKRAIILSATPESLEEHVTNPDSHRSQIEVQIRRRPEGPVMVEQISGIWPNDQESVLVIRGDYVLDSRLFQLLDEEDLPAALIDSAPPENLRPLVAPVAETSRGRLCGVALVSRGWMHARAGGFENVLRQEIEEEQIATIDLAARCWDYPALRRVLRPFWFPAPAPDQRKMAETVLLDAAQKGTQDIPALVHAPIENFIVSYLCKTPITPNQLTVFTNLAGWVATFLFATGRSSWGIALALAVGVLDGLDGKQARVKVETSAVGKLEHWFDALFENSWWIALAWHFRVSGQLPGAFGFLFLLLAAEGVGGLAKWAVIRARGRLIDELTPFDRVVRLVAARRNIHVWILAAGVLLGAPARAFVVIACWEAITSTILLVRAAWTLLASSRGEALP
ncbi:MAG: CDP-alcohol phosphatidyltransferase family protein [Spartobacteria bacterium]